MMIQGTVHRYGDHVDTDVIIPARYLSTSDPAALAAHCMEDIDAEFVSRVKKGDILVAGRNFGCGSSREHAPVAIKASGISCIIAESFARIFFRNAINMGLPLLECPEAVADAKSGHVLWADLSTGTIRNLTLNKSYQAQPVPQFIQGIIQAGGLVNYVKNSLHKEVAQ
ncbi:MAG: 3-isopropylmalate dehydratase small subunit [Christensenellales bacterium]